MKIFLTLLFSIWGLFSPESVISNNGEYFITQMGKLYVKDGTIIHMTKDKTESLLKLVDPRGMYLEDNFLWVVDFDRVVRLDLETGKYKNFLCKFSKVPKRYSKIQREFLCNRYIWKYHLQN